MTIPLQIKLSARDRHGKIATYTYHMDDLENLIEDGHFMLATEITHSDPDGVRCEVEITVPEGV